MLAQAVNSYDAKTKNQMITNTNMNLVLTNGGRDNYQQLHSHSSGPAIVLKGFQMEQQQ